MQPEATADDAEIVSNGEYNECFAVMVEDDFTAYSLAVWSETVGGVTFYYADGNRIFIWKEEDSIQLKQGIYATDDEMSHVNLYGNNEFTFNRHATTSYSPIGNYTIVNGKLLLHSKGNEEFMFEIKDGYLVFFSGDLPEELIQPGTIFRRSVENNGNR